MKYLANFSCGAASAYATYLAIQKYGVENVEIIYMPVANEHDDNKRFLKDCEEKLFGKKVRLIKSKTFPTMDIFSVFRNNDKNKRPFFKTPAGAPCTTKLKRELREDFCRRGMIDGVETTEWCKNQIFGFTVEEKHRYERLKEKTEITGCNITFNYIAPLIDEKKTKDDCYQFLNVHDIEIPKMYKLGFNNNNCIGCVKGGKGYWNHIRKHFPEAFEKMARLEEESDYYLFDVPLSKLDPNAGNHKEPMTECDMLCMLEKNSNQQKFYCDD